MPSSNNNPYDDEALARALQVEYEREYRRRSMQQAIQARSTNNSDQQQQRRRGNAVPPPPPPQPMIVPSAPYESNYIDNNNNNVVGSHRGMASTSTSSRQSTIPPTSFVMAEDAFGTSSNNIEISDAAYARQLEIEMREEERRQRKQHLQQQRDSYRASMAGSATTTSTNRDDTARSSTNVVVPNGRIASTTHSLSSPSQTTASINQDAIPPVQYYSSPNKRNPSSSNNNNNSRNDTLPPYISPLNHRREIASSSGRDGHHRSSSNGNNNGTSNMLGLVPAVTGMYTDEELARRLEQEMRDEELARQAFYEEQIRQSSIAAQTMQHTNNRRGANTPNTAGRSRCRRCMRCIIMLAIVGAAAGICIYYFGGLQNVGDFIPDLDQFKEEDPFNNANIEDANLWRTKNRAGLELVVVNALEDRWLTYFTTAISQWDAGTPDTLTLTVETATPDSTCTAIDGKLKVCNGNYGATNWRGINKILLENNWIYSSAARMNEYYVTDNDDDQRQYTMCHEIGHGFGLPHTDENFFNKDLGNCMDYTNNPATNMQPAYPNFKFLAELYGTVDGSPVPTDDALIPTNNQSAVKNQNTTESQQNGNRYHHRRRRMNQSKLPAHIVSRLADIDTLVDSGEYRTTFRLLSETENGGHTQHEVDLGDGYVVHIYTLNA